MPCALLDKTVQIKNLAILALISERGKEGTSQTRKR